MFPVRVQPSSPTQVEQQPNVLGRYTLEKQAAIFTPRYPFSTRVAYDVSFHLPNNNQSYATTLSLSLAEITATQVTRIFPTTDVLPANLLKFYIEFSAPMAGGNGFNYVHIEKEDGTRVHDPFPEIGVELWDPEQKRFTVLLDPGRIKHGIRINEEMGLPLVPGNAYRFVVQPEWPDATGQPLAQGVEKSFRVVEPDYTTPDPKTWKVEPAKVSTRQPLKLTSPESLDGPLAQQLIWLTDAEEVAVPGTLSLADGETVWSFTPTEPWATKPYTLHVLPRLEDLAGNQIRRPFEIDVRKHNEDKDEEVLIPIKMR